MEGLLWKRVDPGDCPEDAKHRNPPLPGDHHYVAPSWSWASCVAQVEFIHNLANRDYMQCDYASILSHETVLKSPDNPFGEVVDGAVAIRAPLFRLSVHETTDLEGALNGYTFRLTHDKPKKWPGQATFASIDTAPTGKGKGIFQNEGLKWLRSKESYLLVLKGKLVRLQAAKSQQISLQGLIVEPVGSQWTSAVIVPDDREPRAVPRLADKYASWQNYQRLGMIGDLNMAYEHQDAVLDSSGFSDVLLI
jgi:hypothetical protein